MALNKKSQMAAAAGSAGIVLIMAIILNGIGDRVFRRFDLTEEKRFSLSSSTKKLVSELNGKLTITYYASGADNWPGPFRSSRKDILDKLKEIEVHAGGNITLEVVDPSELDANVTDPDAEKPSEKLRKDGFRRQAHQELKNDEYSFRHFFSGFRLTYGKKESLIIPFLYLPEDLEYELMKHLVKLTLKELPTVALFYPRPDDMQIQMAKKRGQPTPATGYDWIHHQNALGSLFAIQITDISKESPIPDKAKVLIIIKPKAFSDRQRYEIERYVAGGGTVLLFLSPIDVQLRGTQWIAEQRDTGLERWLQELGLTAFDNFICDKSCVQRPVYNQYNQAEPKQNPYYVYIKPKNMSKESVLTRHSIGFVLPYPTGLEVNEKIIESHGLSMKTLARTSKETWYEDFKQIPKPDADKLENLTSFKEPAAVMLTLSGKFPFFYDGQPVPEWPKSDEDHARALSQNQGRTKEAPAAKAPPSKPGNLLICTVPEMLNSSQFRTQENYQYFTSSPLPFLLNAVEKFALGEELGKIRTKNYESRIIERYAGRDNAQLRNLIKALLILGTPFLLTLIWFLRWYLQHREQVRYERTFASTIGPSSFSP